MRCKSCDYPLWQIRARLCPECGAPFKPSDFQFVLNSVQFRCPHCEQAYYGTDLNGHLQPSEFDCISCGRRISMDEMVLLPTEGVTEVLTLPGRNPWVERRDNSWLGAWFRTIGMAVGSPRQLGMHTPQASSAFLAFAFATLTNLVYVALGGLWLFLFIGGMASGRGLGVLAAASVVLAMVPIGLLLVAVLTHGFLRLTGPTERGLKGTAKAVWYTSAVNLPSAVPCVSMYIAPLGWIWWAIAAGFALETAHKCRGWRAALAVTLTAVLLGGSLAGGVVIMVFRLGAIATKASGVVTPANVGAVSTTAGTNIALIGADIRKMALATPPTPPRHAIEIMEANPNLSYADTPAWSFSIMIGGQSVAMLPGSTPPQRKATIAAISASLPSNVIAHRLGDYVFTYNGIDLTAAPGGVWTVVYWPNPDHSPLLAGRTFHAVCLDGTLESFTSEQLFDAGLQRQNDVRKKAGLSALPHPKTVTHTRPATPSPVGDGE